MLEPTRVLELAIAYATGYVERMLEDIDIRRSAQSVNVRISAGQVQWVMQNAHGDEIDRVRAVYDYIKERVQVTHEQYPQAVINLIQDPTNQ